MSDRRTPAVPPGRARRARWLGGLVVAAVVAAGALAVGQRVPGVAVPEPAIRSEASPVGATSGSVAPPATHRFDGPDRPPDAPLPEGLDGTSRTWFAAGTWWAVLPESAGGAQHVWALAGPVGPWVDTGTLVDDRPDVDVEVGWDGEDLVVASWGRRSYRSHALRVHRLTLDAEERRWRARPDHPFTVTDRGGVGYRLAVTAGRVWLARPAGEGVELASSTERRPTASEWSVPGVDGAAHDVGAFDVVGSDAGVVVVWRSRVHDRVVVARRGPGGAWSADPHRVGGAAGTDPIDAAATGVDEGADVVALVSVSPATDGENDPALVALAVSPTGADHPPSLVSRRVDALTGASLVVADGRVRVVGRVPADRQAVRAAATSGRAPVPALAEKSAEISSLEFPPGTGERIVTDVAGAAPSTPLLPAGPVRGGGTVVVASGERAGTWATWTSGVPEPPAPAAAADGSSTVVVDDSFDSLREGPAPPSWSSDGRGPDPVARVETVHGLDGLSLVVRGEAGEVASLCRAVPVLSGEIVVTAEVRADGIATRDARLLTLRGPEGTAVAVRITRFGTVAHSTASGRVDLAPVVPGAVLRITVEIHPATTTATLRVAHRDGAPLAEAEVGWLAPGPPVDEVCVRPAPGEGTVLALGGLTVTDG